MFDERFINKEMPAGTPACDVKDVSDDIERDQFFYLLFILIILRSI